MERKPNYREAEKQVAILRGSPDAVATFQIFDDRKKVRVKPEIIHGTLKETFPRLVKANQEGGGIFLMVQPGDGNGRKEQNVTGLEWLFVDLDGSDLQPVQEASIKPHLITKTSVDEDGRERYQAFWKVNPISIDGDRPEKKSEYSRLQGALCDLFDGDRNVTKDLCRVMRLAGFYHQKRDRQLCRIVEANDHEAYDLEVIKDWLDIDDEPQPEAKKPSIHPSERLTEGERNDNLFRYACQKVAQGLAEEEVDLLAICRNEDYCDPPLNDSELSTIVKSALTYTKDHSLSGEKFDPAIYIAHILMTERVINLYGDFYRYENGVYGLWKPVQIKKILWDWSNKTASVSQLKNTVELLEIETHTDPEEVNRPGLLNLKNGVIDPASMTLLPHSPKRKFTIQLLVVYDPDRKTKKPRFRRFQQYLDRVLPEREQQFLLWEILGYCLTTDCRYEKAVLLLGSGHNGKTVLLDIIRALLKGYVSELKLADLSHPYRPSLLENKLVNITAEGESLELVDDVMIKSLISGEDMTVERKFKDPQTIKPYVKLVVAANSLPRTRDKSFGYFRRWIPVHFGVKITEEEKDPTLSEKIIVEELDEIFYGALLGLQRLRKNGRFTTPTSSQVILQDYERLTNPLISYVDEIIELDAEQSSPLSRLYSGYRDWCRINGHRNPMNKQSFRQELEREFGRREWKCEYKKLTSGYYGFSGVLRHNLFDRNQEE